MGIIYEPKGRAREYSPLAVNLYNGCSHGCRYCYAPALMRRSRENYLTVTPRKDILKLLEKDAQKYENTNKQVLLCFTGDPYCKEEKTCKITRRAIEILDNYNIPIAVLTKGGERALRDIDLFKRVKRIKIGATLTFLDAGYSKFWEPNAALPQSRLQMLKEIHKMGIRTWVSLEPVIIPSQSLALIEGTINFVDEYKLGKLNNFNGMDKDIDWCGYLSHAVKILRAYKKEFYVKYDLREHSKIKLFEKEKNMNWGCLWQSAAENQRKQQRLFQK